MADVQNLLLFDSWIM